MLFSSILTIPECNKEDDDHNPFDCSILLHIGNIVGEVLAFSKD